MCAFDVCSDGLFTDHDLVKFGLKHWRFKELFSYWIYATLYDGDNEYQEDPYWATDKMVQQFNDHYKNKFEHGWKFAVDEHILLGWARDQPGGGHKVDRKPRVFGPEYTCISAVGVQVKTTFDHVRSNKVNNKSKYTKEYGTGAACVLRLCEYPGIEGRNSAVISGSWFGDIMCVIGLSKLGLQAITMIKTGTGGYYKQ